MRRSLTWRHRQCPLRHSHSQRAAPLRSSDSTVAPSVTAPLVKICGIVHPDDATLAAESGADFVGLILTPGFKRSVTLDQATEIVSAITAAGAEPVGVFVKEGAAEIVETCDALGISTAQLHGDSPRDALKSLPERIRVFYVVHSEGGEIRTPLPAELAQVNANSGDPAYWKKAIDWVSSGRRNVDYVLVDKKEAGSDEALNWTAREGSSARIKPPKGCSKRGWAMAGGLDAGNVALAVAAQRPDVVDVSGGVADSGGVRKDPGSVRAFVAGAKGG